MSQDPLAPPKRASRRQLDGETETGAVIHSNGHVKANGAAPPIFTDAEYFGIDQEVAVEWKGNKNLIVRYNADRMPHAVRRELAARARQKPAEGEEQDLGWVWESLAILMTGWNYVIDAETLETYPISVAALERKFAFDFGLAILNAIHEDINPPALTSSSAST